MISSEERRQLEVAFTKQLDFAINELVKAEFTENDIVTFTETVKIFLKFADLRQYVLTTLYDKVQETFKLIKPNDPRPHASYRLLLRVILDIGDEELIDAMETFLAKDSDPNYFLILMEEELAQGTPLVNSEKLFISLLGIHKYKLETINRFLSIIEKGPSHLVEKLLEKGLYGPIHLYIQQLAENNIQLLDEIVPVILDYKHPDLNRYVGLSIELMNVSNKYTYQLVNESKYMEMTPSVLGVFILTDHSHKMLLVKSMCEFLHEFHAADLERFEEGFLAVADGSSIVQYSLNVPTSNKRKILRQLIGMREDVKEEHNLVEFIKHFPEYKALLPML